MGYVRNLMISCAVTFGLYFFALLFRGLGYASLESFEESDFKDDVVGKAFVEPVMFVFLMLCFWFSVTQDQRVFYVLLFGFPVLLILQMLIAFGSLNDNPNLGELESSRTYCKAFFEERGGGVSAAGDQSDKEPLCKMSLALSYFNLGALAVDLFFVVKIILSFKGFEKLPKGEPYKEE